MEQHDAKEAEQLLLNAILDTAYPFSVGDKAYRLYPVTLGKELLLKPLLDEAGLLPAMDGELLASACMNAARGKRNVSLRIVALNTLGSRSDLQDEAVVTGRMAELGMELEEDDLASMLLICMREMLKTEDLMKITGIGRDRERMRSVQKVKKDSPNTVSFGGVSVYGRLLDVACERYGWSMQYVLWGISSANLQLMLADQLTSLYLSNEELNAIDGDDETIDGDDPSNRQRLHEMINN